MGSLTRFPAHLTQLYTEAKRSALNNTKQDVTYTHSSIDREFRTQKDRLLAWGLEWSDGENGSDGNIDEPAARAGLTAAVSSVLSHIKEVLIQAEGIRRSVLSPNQSVFSSSQTPEKTPWSVLDEAECKGLLQDLTTSIDALCDLARARKALASGTHPTFSADEDDEITDLKPLAKKPIFETSSFASSEVTLVNPVSFSRPVLSPYAGAPPHIDFHALLLPPESPPSYDSIGMPSATRQIAHLLKSKVPLSVSEGLHGTSEQVSVLVEYANFDSVYRDTGVNPPLERLISLAGFLRLPFLQSEQGITLLGYFEDPHQPRIGLVYDFIGPAHEGLDIMMYASGTIAPVSLLNVLQKAHRASKTSDNIHEAPALELRFQMGLRITEKIKELHDHGLAHGNISSGNAIIFKNRKDERLWPTDLRHLILSSFDIFSRERYEHVGSDSHLNIYKHPEDDGKQCDEKTAMKYDVYSLGLLLLEIGLWVPLSALWKQKYSTTDFRERLEKNYIPKLAWKCGTVYMRMVQSCLKASDTDSKEPPLSHAYDDVFGRLRRCCLLDEHQSVVDTFGQFTQTTPRFAARTEASTRFRKRRSEKSSEPSTPRYQTAAGKSSSSTTSPASQSPSPPLDRSYRLASLPNIAAALPLAYAGVSSSTNESLAILHSGSHAGGRIRSLSSSSDLKQTFSAAATTFQDVWRSKRESASEWKEAVRKVKLIQSRWREIRMRQAANTDRDMSGQPRTGLVGVPRRSNESPAEEAEQLTHAQALQDQNTRLKLYPVKLPQSVLDDWHARTGMRLARIVERALKGSSESSSVDLVGLGHSQLTAKPTILVTCTSTARVKAAIRRKFDFDRTIFDLKVRQGRISLARRQSHMTGSAIPRRCGGRGGAASESASPNPSNPYHQERPLCGASIGAYLEDHGHLMPVSFGGVILVDDEPFGMSVHHMLEPSSDAEQSDYDTTGENSDGEEEEDDDDDDDDGGPFRSSANNQTDRRVPPIQRPSAFDIEYHSGSDISDIGSSDEDDGYESSDFESDVSDTESVDTSSGLSQCVEPGDTPGYYAEGDHDIVITQPALVDAMALDLHVDDIEQEDLDDDHIQSYKLGGLFASSGLRRLRKNGMKHEIDWALIKLEPPRLQPYNLVQGGRRYCKSPASFCPNLESPVCRKKGDFTPDEDLYPVSIVPFNKLANLDVHCFGRTSGLKGGRVGAAMSFVKIYGRTTFSQSWTVIGEFGVGGDSGAWVIDNASGRVCGHVLAEKDGLTYICPMDILFEDIRHTLGASRVLLPGAENDAQQSPIVSADAEAEDLADVVGLMRLSQNGRAAHSRLRSLPLRGDCVVPCA